MVGGLLGAVGARLFFRSRNFFVTQDTVGLALAIAVAIGLVSAAIPAYRASRITVAEALRRVG